MADEFEIQNNPDNVPSAVSTGYQRQNTNSEIARNGVDLSVITAAGITNEVTVNISGGVDVNGVMYSCKTLVVLSSIPNGTRYIKLVAGSTTDYLTPQITSNYGTFDSTKNARYDSGDRVLDWLIITTSGISVVYRIVSNFKIYTLIDSYINAAVINATLGTITTFNATTGNITTINATTINATNGNIDNIDSDVVNTSEVYNKSGFYSFSGVTNISHDFQLFGVEAIQEIIQVKLSALVDEGGSIFRNNYGMATGVYFQYPGYPSSPVNYVSIVSLSTSGISSFSVSGVSPDIIRVTANFIGTATGGIISCRSITTGFAQS